MNTSMQAGVASSRFVAPSVREALRMARENLGPQALVLSNRVTAQGIEIVASTEQAVPPPRLPSGRPVGTRRSSAAQRTAAHCARLAASGDADLLVRDVPAMRSLIDDQLADFAWSDALQRDPLRGHLLRMLLGTGLSARLVKELLRNLPPRQSLANGVTYVKAMLARQLTMLHSEERLMQDGGVFALVGPTGVGKTTTTAKLAARCVMRFGADKLALVTTDSYRIGAYEQLRIYGQILGVSVHAVKDASDLELVLANLREKHMVLIDTVGMSQRDRAVADQVAMLCGASRPVKRLLLLNAASHGDTLDEVVQAYRVGTPGAARDDLAGCILTKVDEATHPGVMLDVAIRHQLPVHYVSNGQKVPEDLILGERDSLINGVFQPRSRRSLFVATEIDHEPPPPWPHEADVAPRPAKNPVPASPCQQLIEVPTQDVDEIAIIAGALADAGVGFQELRALWAAMGDDRVRPEAIQRSVLSQASAASLVHCSDNVLSICGEIAQPDRAGAGGEVLFGTLLLSDRTGLPFAAPNPLLGTAAAPGTHLLGWTQPPEFAKPLVHVLAAIPPAELIWQWESAGHLWAASGTAQTLEQFGGLATGLLFSKPVPTVYRNKPAWSSVAQLPLRLRAAPVPDGVTPAAALQLHCVIRRIVDVESGEPLVHHYVLASAAIQASAQQMALWPAWRDAAAPYFKLLALGIEQLVLEGAAPLSASSRRVLLAGQVARTALLLQCKDDARALAARQGLARLSGRDFAPAGPVPGSVLFDGMGKLLALLDAVDSDGATAPRRSPAAVVQS